MNSYVSSKNGEKRKVSSNSTEGLLKRSRNSKISPIRPMQIYLAYVYRFQSCHEKWEWNGHTTGHTMRSGVRFQIIALLLIVAIAFVSFVDSMPDPGKKYGGSSHAPYYK